MTGNRVDPTVASYLLKVDNYISLFIRNAAFTSLTSLHFDISSGVDQNFFKHLLNRYLPYQSWSLIILDSSLNELDRYSWNQSRVMSLVFPALDAQSNSLLSLSVDLSLAGLAEGSQAAQGHATKQAGHLTTGRVDPLPAFAFLVVIDALTDPQQFVAKIDSFTLGTKAAKELGLTVKPEANANPYRQWLSGGNQPSNGRIDILRTTLKVAFRIRFTGMRVTSVAPPLTTYAPTPATVRLSYDTIHFETP